MLLEVEKLSGWYGAARILFDLDLKIRRGEVVALMGRNGAGKSTTFLSLMGMMERRSGTIRLMDRDISQSPSYRVAQLGLGFVPEDRRIFTDLTVAENLDIGRQPPRYWPDGTPLHVWTSDELYELFPNLASMKNRGAGRMSGGEQQMLTIARTLMGNPFLLLLDEPSEGVAPVIVEQMAKMILELKNAGVSVLLSEQNIHFARFVSNRVYMLEKGHLTWAGSMEELTQSPDISLKYLSI
ncbi:ABC transporter ATP-binding protein [Bradyrhizobium pachyrhizi]|uniref:ABC transporter ATP-binding protein n=1 Tax=Bradyrhizobium pachyrhizi TaxID=280333 RepID=UPI003D3671C8